MSLVGCSCEATIGVRVLGLVRIGSFREFSRGDLIGDGPCGRG